MWQRVFVPGFGNVWMETEDAAEAKRRAIDLAQSKGVVVNSTDLAGVTVVGSSGPSAGAGWVVDGAGNGTDLSARDGGTGKVPGNASPLPQEGGAGGADDGTGATGVDFNIGDDATGGRLDEVATLAAYLRGAQRRNPDRNLLSPRTLADRTLRDDGFSLLNNFRLNEALRGFGDEDLGKGFTPSADAGSRFENYSAGRGIVGARKEAFSSIRGLLTANRRIDSPLNQFYDDPTGDAADVIGKSAQDALASKISPLALSLFNLPTGRDLRDEFLARTGGGDPGGEDFIQLVNRRYGLNRLRN